jgi:hypothetical protein
MHLALRGSKCDAKACGIGELAFQKSCKAVGGNNIKTDTGQCNDAFPFPVVKSVKDGLECPNLTRGIYIVCLGTRAGEEELPRRRRMLTIKHEVYVARITVYALFSHRA